VYHTEKQKNFSDLAFLTVPAALRLPGAPATMLANRCASMVAGAPGENA